MTIGERFLASCGFALTILLAGQTAPAALFDSVNGTMDAADNYSASVTDSGDNGTVFSNKQLDINVVQLGFVEDGEDQGVIVGFDVKDSNGFDLGASTDPTTIMLTFSDNTGLPKGHLFANFTGGTAPVSPAVQVFDGSFNFVSNPVETYAAGDTAFEIGIPVENLGDLFDSGIDSPFQLTITARELATTHVDQAFFEGEFAPEPASAALLALGGGAIFARRRCRHRR